MILIDTALAGRWDMFANAISHIILPAGLLGYLSMAYISRMTRSFMMNELGIGADELGRDIYSRPRLRLAADAADRRRW
jgi:hypothetical protein